MSSNTDDCWLFEIILPDEPSEVSGTGDFDDFFSDLDPEPSNADEFDDLFDDL